MAERLENYEFPTSGKTSPYLKYLDGNTWRLRRGVDFTAGKVASVVSSCHSQAKKKGGKVLTRIESDDAVVVRFVPAAKSNGNGNARPRAMVSLEPSLYDN